MFMSTTAEGAYAYMYASTAVLLYSLKGIWSALCTGNSEIALYIVNFSWHWQMVRRDEGGTHSIGTDGRRFGVHDEGNNETCPFIRKHC